MIPAKLIYTGHSNAYRYALEITECTDPHCPRHILHNCPMGETKREAEQNLKELNENRAKLGLETFSC